MATRTIASLKLLDESWCVRHPRQRDATGTCHLRRSQFNLTITWFAFYTYADERLQNVCSATQIDNHAAVGCFPGITLSVSTERGVDLIAAWSMDTCYLLYVITSMPMICVSVVGFCSTSETAWLRSLRVACVENAAASTNANTSS